MSEKRTAKVVKANEVKPMEMMQGKLGASSRRLGVPAGGLSLGCSLVELAVGNQAYPNHFHSSMEEAMYVLDGEGTLRIGKDEMKITAGDYVAFPPGPDFSHSLMNTGKNTLSYLVMSAPATPVTMDILGYPDSKKLSFASGVEPGKVAWKDGAWVMKLIKEDTTQVGYFDDEPMAQK
jgi:uncharacterized cupin superfamily protein